VWIAAPAARTASRCPNPAPDNGDTLFAARSRRKHFIAGKIEKSADQFILGEAQGLGADRALAIGDEFLLGLGMDMLEPLLHVRDDCLPHRRGIAGVTGGDCLQPQLQLGGIDELGWLKWMLHSLAARSALSS
jgi:hypothetical protein